VAVLGDGEDDEGDGFADESEEEGLESEESVEEPESELPAVVVEVSVPDAAAPALSLPRLSFR
jgi:hypothetical protein